MAQGPLGRSGRLWLKLLAPALGSIGALVALGLVGPELVNQGRLSHWLAPLGPLAPLAFILLLGIRPVTLLPGQLFTAVGGLLFGTFWATVYSLLGSLLASSLIALLARKLGTPLMKRAAGKDYPAFARLARAHGFKYALITCASPLLPTDVAQAIALSAGARFWRIALGCLLGTLPGTLLTAQFGSAVGQGKWVLTLFTGLGVVVSVIAGVWLGRLMLVELRADPTEGKRPQADPTSPPPPPRRVAARRARRT